MSPWMKPDSTLTVLCNSLYSLTWQIMMLLIRIIEVFALFWHLFCSLVCVSMSSNRISYGKHCSQQLNERVGSAPVVRLEFELPQI